MYFVFVLWLIDIGISSPYIFKSGCCSQTFLLVGICSAAFNSSYFWQLLQVLWWFYFSKIIDFIDTLLMVLRKKNSQITFLHVFHHASMLNMWWFCFRLIPGGQSWFASALNSFVHVFMYSYYLLNLFPSARKYLWWKRYLTQMQLTQFLLIFLHSVNACFYDCDFPKWPLMILSFYVIIMIILFSNFYMQSYMSKLKSNSESSGKHAVSENSFSRKLE